MPDYSSLVPSIAQSAGVPVSLALGMFGQESGLGIASSNVGQVLPSTAANPGYGMAPMSQADLADPVKNMKFSLAYLKAKAAANGYANLSDPSQAAAALKLYNGGGDPNYVANVNARMAGSPLPGGPGYTPPTLQAPSDIPVQASAPPPMPDSFGAAPAATAPTAPAKVDMSGHEGDPLVAMGMAMMGGNGWHDAMARAGDAYSAAQARSLELAKANAGFVNDAQNRDATAPERAAQTAMLRAQGWNALNAPTTITAEQALQGQLTQRGQNVQMADVAAQAAARAQANMLQAKGQPQTWIVPSDGTAPDQYISQTHNGAGQIQFQMPDGSTQSTPPSGAVPLSAYQHPDPLVSATMKANAKTETDMATSATAARQQNDRFQQSLDALNAPGANVSPGMMGQVGRGIDAALGTNIFGNLTDTQVADALNKQEILGQFKTAAQGQGGRGSNALRSFIMEAQPHMGQDPNAMRKIIGVLQDNNNMQSAVQDIYSGKDVGGVPGLSPADRYQLRRSGSVAQWRDRTFAALQAAKAQATAATSPSPSSGGAGSLQNTRPPLSSFGSQGAATAAPTDDTVAVDDPAAAVGLPQGTRMRLPTFDPLPVLNGG